MRTWSEATATGLGPGPPKRTGSPDCPHRPEHCPPLESGPGPQGRFSHAPRPLIASAPKLVALTSGGGGWGGGEGKKRKTALASPSVLLDPRDPRRSTGSRGRGGQVGEPAPIHSLLLGSSPANNPSYASSLIPELSPLLSDNVKATCLTQIPRSNSSYPSRPLSPLATLCPRQPSKASLPFTTTPPCSAAHPSCPLGSGSVPPPDRLTHTLPHALARLFSQDPGGLSMWRPQLWSPAHAGAQNTGHTHG